MRKYLLLYFIVFFSSICVHTQNNNWPIKYQLTPHTPKIKSEKIYQSFYDLKNQWPSIIKQFWGPGESRTEKLQTFDLYQDFVRAHNATFAFNPINWDSIAASLRAKVTDSTSCGEFSRILNDLAFVLRDGHAHARSNVMLTTPLNPGTPILPDGGSFINHFGAGLTPLADSSLLVYKVVVPNHPLGLEPGDRILGYQGIPWHQIVRELLDGGVPHTLWIGASPSAFKRVLLWSAGESWHLFDTIDVVKYSTGETLHLALDTMVTLNVPGVPQNNEQLPVPGVPMPVYNPNRGAVTYGIVEGTNIGYIYVYHHAYPAVSTEFEAAVEALKNTDGLIIDLRLDWGGSYGLNKGIGRLLNHSTHTLDMQSRCSPNDLYSICPNSQWFIGDISADYDTYYDRPIAVLLGPGCVSYGDISSWQLGYVPNVRTFGRSPMTAYSGMVLYNQPYRTGYDLQCPDVTFLDHYNQYPPVWGQEFPIDEEVWLTPEGVASGVDDVAKRAIEWIDNLVYARSVICDKPFYNTDSDTVKINSVVENPNSNLVTARAYLNTESGELVDSVELSKQIKFPKGEEWNGKFNLPAEENFYSVSVTAFDLTDLTSFDTPNAYFLTTAGPVTLDSVTIIYYPNNNSYAVRPYVKNEGSTMGILNARIKLNCNDSGVTGIIPYDQTLPLPTINPGQSAAATFSFTVRVDSTFQGTFNFQIEIMRDYWTYWVDSMMITVTNIIDEIVTQPGEFLLNQNYPNPFNPSTVISWQSPVGSKQTIKVFDVLGNEITTLVNEYRPAGRYEVEFNASILPSGVYFYQLKAGEFIQTMKMLLIK